jgi:hypothetical protein
MDGDLHGNNEINNRNDMSEKIDLIKPHIRHFCKEGYLDDGKKKTLYDLSDQYQVSIKEVDALVKEELRQVREKHIDYIYKESGQPDAALHDTPDLFTESKRQFPDMINIGQLRLSLNENVEAPAFLPVKGLAGISLIHNNLSENEVNNLLQNITVRLLLSLPRGLAKITLIDPLNLGGSFINLSGLDQQFLHILDDDKAILPFLQNFTKEIAAFNFNELGNKYADIHAYNKVNRSKARPFQIILCSSFPECFDANALSELERIFRFAAKTGLFFIVASKENGLTANQAVYKTLVANTTVIKQTNDGYEVLSSVDLTLFNKGYKLVPNFNSVFNSDTILKINNEFDSQKYPLTKKVGASKSAISEIELLGCDLKIMLDFKKSIIFASKLRLNIHRNESENNRKRCIKYHNSGDNTVIKRNVDHRRSYPGMCKPSGITSDRIRIITA